MNLLKLLDPQNRSKEVFVNCLDKKNVLLQLFGKLQNRVFFSKMFDIRYPQNADCCFFVDIVLEKAKTQKIHNNPSSGKF